MKRLLSWASTHAPLVTALLLSVGFATAAAATGDYHIPSGLLMSSNAQLVTTQRLATVGFSAGDKYLPNQLVVDSNGQLVMTLRDSSGNALTPGAASTLTTTDDSTTNASYCPLFQTASGGTNPVKTDCSNYTYNPSTGRIVAKNLTLNSVSGNRTLCINPSNQITDCGSGFAPTFASTNTCGASNFVPCKFTWSCTMSSGACTTTQTVYYSSSVCTVSPTVSPDLSSTNVVSTWVTLSSTTLTIHVSDMLGTSSAAFSGNGVCL